MPLCFSSCPSAGLFPEIKSAQSWVVLIKTHAVMKVSLELDWPSCPQLVVSERYWECTRSACAWGVWTHISVCVYAAINTHTALYDKRIRRCGVDACGPRCFLRVMVAVSRWDVTEVFKSLSASVSSWTSLHAARRSSRRIRKKSATEAVWEFDTWWSVVGVLSINTFVRSSHETCGAFH